MVQKIKQILESPAQKKAYNEQLFATVAPRYDVITKILSFGCDGYWKKKLVQSLPTFNTSPRLSAEATQERRLEESHSDVSRGTPNNYEKTCADLACGTGDITFLLAEKYPEYHIDGIDLTESMLIRARQKLAHKNSLNNISFTQADMCLLPYSNQSIDIITGGYALRNAPSLEHAIIELSRVLKPGGTAAFLDFSKPKNKILQKISYYLLKFWGSVWGILLHGDHTVYSYIAESLALYPDRQALKLLLEKHGLCVQKSKLFFCGFLELLVCTKI